MMVSSEASPWAKSGGLADVVGALPVALSQLGHPVCVVIPRYMDAHKADATRVLNSVPIPLGGGTYFIDVWATTAHGVTTYFVDHPACTVALASTAMPPVTSAITISASLSFQSCA